MCSVSFFGRAGRGRRLSPPMKTMKTNLPRQGARGGQATWPLLAICSTLAAAGCGSERLWLPGPATAAVGELTLFSVSADLPCGGKIFGGPSDPTGDLQICRPFHKITKVVDASCEGDGCVIESIDPPNDNGFTYLNVVGNADG